MTCFHPVKAYKSRERNPTTGRYKITFNPVKALIEGTALTLPCGRCSGCLIDKSKSWAIRCMHEKKMHDDSSFITLTYNDQCVPADFSVKLKHWQDFMKRLREKISPTRIRFFACGEYGDRDLRPHYHALIFGYAFPDKKQWAVRRSYPVYRSQLLEQVWPYGYSEIGNLDYKSAAYCARYCMKKVSDKINPEHYYRRSPIDGQVYQVAPEFAVMSRRPGIGTGWFNQFSADAFPSDFLIVDGRKAKPPAFYLNKLEEDEQLVIKRARKMYARTKKQDSTRERLADREAVLNSKLKLLKREL